MFTILLLSLCILTNNVLTNYIEDSKLVLKDVIKQYGYPLEEHEIITSDGYILTTHRIKHGKNGNITNKNPILLGHGLGVTSEIFLALGNTSLPYYLADNGYDVWMMNARGNYFSRNHTHLNPDTDKRFWNFRIDEIACIDLPTNIDYILNITEEKALFYIGHSQGTTTFFMLTSAMPEYNKKIKLSVSMGPSVYYIFNENVYDLLTLGGQLLNIIEGLNILELGNDMIRTFLREMCTKQFEARCVEMFEFVANAEFKFDTKIFHWVLRTTPSGLSIYQFRQSIQLATSGFRYYDYGGKGNLKKYNSRRPPEFNLTNSRALSALFYSDGDWITSPEAVRVLGKNLPNVINYKVPLKEFTHFDFLIHLDVIKLVYLPMINLMKKYNI
ncbi:unnamed protein product [Brassicogethes aeneus]|uniref:Lipase n=1 Tax=Brassicogethes aeneus TaxID=1431903 RepID=A0A9P0B2G2_BRAAE|nr:unnamed protein product [Brassicogethes aeneus]